MSKRDGKASFCMQDRDGRIQIYELMKLEDVYEGFKKFDIGDLVGVKEGFRTRKGEISVRQVKHSFFQIPRPLPEKWHGLKDGFKIQAKVFRPHCESGCCKTFIVSNM